MTDTQWPRYIVFEQPEAGAPHRYVGSVHAPDAEMALLNARDIFARRPGLVNLWVVGADQIYARTRGELAATPPSAEAPPAGAALERYFVAQKQSQKGLSTYVGEVQAASPAHALALALAQFANAKALVWWVFPSRAVTASAPDDTGSLFASALDKPFRDQSFYPVVTLMREARKKSSQQNPSE